MLRRARLWRYAPLVDKRMEPEKTYLQKRAELETKEMRARRGVVVRPSSTNQIADMQDREHSISKSKLGQMTVDWDGNFTTNQEDMATVMKARHAALILDIPEQKLYGLKENEVHEAWYNAYAKCRTRQAREEVDAARDHLTRYLMSDFAVERTKDHYAEKIEEAKSDIKRALQKDKERGQNAGFMGIGLGHITVTFLFTVSTVVMYRYLEKNDAQRAVVKARRHFASAMSGSANDEPAPDYQTRYRDTPTSIDEQMQLPHPDISEPKQRALLEQQDADDRREQELLANMTSDVGAEAERRRLERIDLEQRREAMRGFGPVQMIDSMVAVAPPKALRDLRSEDLASYSSSADAEVGAPANAA